MYIYVCVFIYMYIYVCIYIGECIYIYICIYYTSVLIPWIFYILIYCMPVLFLLYVLYFVRICAAVKLQFPQGINKVLSYTIYIYILVYTVINTACIYTEHLN